MTVDNILKINNQTFTNIKPVDKDVTLDEAKTITENNGIDEIYFKDSNDKLFIAYGEEKNRGSLPLDDIKVNFIGKYNNEKVKVLHVDNEINTALEGAKQPLGTASKVAKGVTETSIGQGVAQGVATVTAFFVGKSAIDAVIVPAGVATATTGATAGNALANTVKTMPASVGQLIKQGAKIALVVGGVIVVVGGITIGVSSAYQAIKGAHVKNNYETINMVTGQNK